ncbi:centromere protein X isoform X1 [Dipodomys spectabilis]|uniref:centromere protein X isoform X1 n=1 Tax=Dipodomys spectabilis TaxID=105255 RepID=UPI001C53C9C6|nr:centromere protein X isoform X1 [Dipodomys spectabilis]
MEGASSGFQKELVSRLLHLHFRDSKTRGAGCPLEGGEGVGCRELPLTLFFLLAVSGDALQLMAELLRIFVTEAAVRGIRQAQAEDAALVDVDQLEKVLPQLLLDF